MALSRSMKNLMHDQYASQRGSAYGSPKPAMPGQTRSTMPAQAQGSFGRAVSTMARSQPRGGVGGMVKQAVDTRNLATRSDIGIQPKLQPQGRGRPGFSFLDQARQRPAFTEDRPMRGGSRRFLR